MLEAIRAMRFGDSMVYSFGEWSTTIAYHAVGYRGRVSWTVTLRRQSEFVEEVYQAGDICYNPEDADARVEEYIRWARRGCPEE